MAIMEGSYKVISFPAIELLKDKAKFKNLILAKWMRSLRRDNDFFKLIDSSSYYEAYQRYIEFIFNKPNITIQLAVLSDDPDIVLGFSVNEGSILYYCYVNKDFRRQGIAKSLVSFKVDVITHITSVGLIIWNLSLPKAIFNPFA